MNHEGLYDLETTEFKKVKNIQFLACMGPPGGGRNHITQRYLRHYTKVFMEHFPEDSLTSIFRNIVDWFFSRQTEPFAKSVQALKDNLVQGLLIYSIGYARNSCLLLRSCIIFIT